MNRTDMETEIKLLLPTASRPAVEAHPLFAAAPARRVHNLSTYYDTPDFALRARGVALRVRRAGDGFVQTVKSAEGFSGGGGGNPLEKRSGTKFVRCVDLFMYRSQGWKNNSYLINTSLICFAKLHQQHG